MEYNTAPTRQAIKAVRLSLKKTTIIRINLGIKHFPLCSTLITSFRRVKNKCFKVTSPTED